MASPHAAGIGSTPEAQEMSTRVCYARNMLGRSPPMITIFTRALIPATRARAQRCLEAAVPRAGWTRRSLGVRFHGRGADDRGRRWFDSQVDPFAFGLEMLAGGGGIDGFFPDPLVRSTLGTLLGCLLRTALGGGWACSRALRSAA